MRLVTKPGDSLMSTVSLPICRRHFLHHRHRLVAGLEGADDLDQLHLVDGVEEVHAAHAAGSVEDGGHLGDAERRGVRGDDRSAGAAGLAPRRAARSLRSIFSGAASITRSASRTASATAGRGRQAAAASPRRRPASACRARRPCATMPAITAAALSSCAARDVVEAGVVAGRHRRVGDAVAHGAGAEDGEWSKWRRHEKRTPSWHCGQRPVKCGWPLLEVGARCPSAASSLSNSRCCSSRSSARPR